MSVSLPEGEPSVMLFSETPARAIVSLCGNGYREFRSCARSTVCRLPVLARS